MKDFKQKNDIVGFAVKLQSDSNARNDQEYSPEHSYSKNGMQTEASLQTVTGLWQDNYPNLKD